jgi:hypothetical protein
VPSSPDAAAATATTAATPPADQSQPVTTLLKSGETPEVVKGLAAVFGGSILTLASGAFRSIRSSG